MAPDVRQVGNMTVLESPNILLLHSDKTFFVDVLARDFMVMKCPRRTSSKSDSSIPSNFKAERPRTLFGPTQKIGTGHGNMYITINTIESGGPLEVFGTLGKAGGCNSASLEAISRLRSLALSTGVLIRSCPDAFATPLESFSQERMYVVRSDRRAGWA